MKGSTLVLRVGTLAAGAALVVLAAGTTGLAQQGAAVPAQGGAPGGRAAGPAGQAGVAGAPGGGRARGPAPDTLGAGPWEYGAGPNRYKVSVLARGLDHPWGIAFLPNGDMLVTERIGRIRVIRNGVLDPTPLAGVPADLWANPGQLGGMLDITLHPNFAQNRLIYFAYSKQHPDPAKCTNHVNACVATTAVARAKWDGGSTLTDVKDIIVTNGWAGDGEFRDKRSVGPASGSFGSRVLFAKDGTLFITTGDRNIPPISQDMLNHNGKILRLKDDGSVPADNPFVGNKAYAPEIWSTGHRNPLGLYWHPTTGALWETEEGPQGGDEINIIEKGKNYGWPLASLGRNYDGTIVGNGFSAPGVQDPLVFWVPAIAISGLSIYDGDKFPAWKNQAFVGAMRAGTGQFVARVTFNAKGEPTGRDHSMLADLKQRIREIKPGPDGYLYALTDQDIGAILKIEPVAAPATAPAATPASR